MPVVQTSASYPSLELIFNMIRAICNDSFAGSTSTQGEGQILTDQSPAGSTTNNPFLLNHVNSAIRELYRKMRNVGTPTLIVDNYILQGLPPVNGPLGASIPDPTIQTYLDTTGYFDGSSYHTQFTLPSDILVPLRLWERNNGTTDTFMEMEASQQTNGLYARDQVDRLVSWEWRQDRINFNGALQYRDIRIRYQAVFPQFFTASMNFSNTFIPIIDCEDFVAYTAASKIALALGTNPAIVQTLKGDAAQHLFDLRNEQVRRMQQLTYMRRPYDDSDTAQELDVYGI